MNILLWCVQSVLALFYLAGGSYKITQYETIAAQMAPLTRIPTGILGGLEMLGGILLVVPAAFRWMRVLTPIAAAVLAVETLALAVLYARHSLGIAAANPFVWALVLGLLAACVAYGRFSLRPLA